MGHIYYNHLYGTNVCTYYNLLYRTNICMYYYLFNGTNACMYYNLLYGTNACTYYYLLYGSNACIQSGLATTTLNTMANSLYDTHFWGRNCFLRHVLDSLLQLFSSPINVIVASPDFIYIAVSEDAMHVSTRHLSLHLTAV
jgi:hypothetical protein